ncbi:MAG: DUF4416 family protein [Phycisphaerae bacterium]|nr:DUF4416 family protein [Phycisphaerae bacterium]
MWELQTPKPVKLIIAVLAADEDCLKAALEAINTRFGNADFLSDVWQFSQTDYYKDEIGENILRQFVSIEKLIDPGTLAQIKHDANSLEQQLADSLKLALPRPANLDPGFMEPSKLVLASTKNFSHRIYIGNKMFAEVTLVYEKGNWRHFEYTFPDYRQQCYFDFFNKVRTRLLEQLKSKH